MKRYIFFFVILILALVGCTSKDDTSSKTDQSLQGLAYNMETKQWSATMSNFLEQVNNPKVTEAYEIAINHPEVLQYVPCYCGCGEDGHKSNTDCFVQDVNGSVAQLDSMGLG